MTEPGGNSSAGLLNPLNESQEMISCKEFCGIQAFTVLFFVVFSSRAELNWEFRQIEIKAALGQSSVEAAFPFQNTGRDVIEIINVTSKCSCTSATAEKRIIAPGESGSIKTTFIFGHREGFQQKQFEVITDKQKRTVLQMAVDIPRLYEVSPKRLVWSQNPSTQSCRLLNVSTNPVSIIAVKSTNTDFELELVEHRVGFEYEVRVHPLNLSRRSSSMINITTEPVNGKASKTYRVYAVCY